MKYLIVVVGPTAVGKTQLCFQLAQYFRTEIISADARQFYKEMNIGTAQPDAKTMQRVTHHFVNFLPIQTSYNAAIFEKEALQVIGRLFKKYDYLLLTGGAGLYVKAVCEGLHTMLPVNKEVREQLNTRLKQGGLAPLVEELAEKDPMYYQEVDLKNPRRVIRALEVCITTGQPYTSFRKHHPAKRPFEIIKIGLTRERAECYQRINQRVDEMIARGLFKEAQALYPLKEYNALQTVGYQEIFGYLAGHYDREEAIRLLKRNSRRYAKRQCTWFRKDKQIHWFHPEDFASIITYIKESHGGTKSVLRIGPAY